MPAAGARQESGVTQPLKEKFAQQSIYFDHWILWQFSSHHGTTTLSYKQCSSKVDLIPGRLHNLFLGGGFEFVRQCAGEVAPGGDPLLPQSADRPRRHQGGYEGGRGGRRGTVTSRKTSSHKRKGKEVEDQGSTAALILFLQEL